MSEEKPLASGDDAEWLYGGIRWVPVTVLKVYKSSDGNMWCQIQLDKPDRYGSEWSVPMTAVRPREVTDQWILERSFPGFRKVLTIRHGDVTIMDQSLDDSWRGPPEWRCYENSVSLDVEVFERLLQVGPAAIAELKRRLGS